MEDRKRLLNGHSDDDALLLLWIWVKENGPEIKTLINWRHRLMGAIAVLLALGVVNAVIAAVTVLGGGR